LNTVPSVFTDLSEAIRSRDRAVKIFYNPKMSSKRKKEKEERGSGMGSLNVEEILAAGGPPQKQKKEEGKHR